MEGLKPIKRNPALVSFSKDHHFGLLLAWKIRQGLKAAIAPERISDYLLYFFREDLQQHFREEEEFMFNKLAIDDPLRIQAEAEHATLYALIAQVREQPTDISLLTEFADKLESHIRFEERSLFNHLQEILPAEVLQNIPVHTDERAKNADSKWQDQFWIKTL